MNSARRDHHQRQARALQRRLDRRGDLSAVKSLRWTALASVWAHMLVVAAVAFSSGGTSAIPSEPGVVTVLRVAPANERGHDLPGADVEVSPASSHAAADMAPSPFSGRRPVTRGAARTVEPTQVAPLPRTDAAQSPATEVDYVRTQPAQALEDAPEYVRTISARHASAATDRRTPVTSRTEGPLTLRSEGTGDRGGRPTRVRQQGTPRSAMGNRATAPRDPVPITVGGGGGGASGEGASEGTDHHSGPDRGGGAVARAASGSSSGARGRPVGSGAQQAAVPPAPRAAHPTPDAPGWWRPLATRVENTRQRVRAASASAASPSVTLGDGLASVERHGRRTNRGGAGSASAEIAAVGQTAEAPGIGPRVAAPGTADPVEELRADLGFGSLDREELRPRPAWAGTMGAEGQADSSPHSVADVPIHWDAAISAVGTPLGAWVERADALIGRQWNGRDLDAHDRARGIQGQVTVQFVIQPNGRVTQAKVVRSSGHSTLDQMALGAIPPRLPRLPKEHADASLNHRVTLRYRNPLVATRPDE